jgi:alpha-amylase/alpha-mannosidase (GH57 family)
VSHTRFVAIHGHFYQPPRESPWLETIEVQDSAAPHHDWNARVTAECYAPNTAARLVDEQDRILDVVDNFAALAFDVGPTLMTWLERERPDVYGAILQADRASRAARGHGNAQSAVARLWHAGTLAEREVLAPLMTALGFAPSVCGSSSERA